MGLKRDKRRARFGPAWWDRGGHFGMIEDGRAVVYGTDERPWPRPCPICVEWLEAGQ